MGREGGREGESALNLRAQILIKIHVWRSIVKTRLIE